MIIKFQSHSDYVLATTMLVNSIDQVEIFNELVSLFYEANIPLGTKPLIDIKLSKKEIEIITNNNTALGEILNKQPDNIQLESLVYSFCDVAVAVEHNQEQNTLME